MNPAKIFSAIGPGLNDVARVLESVHAQLELMNEKLDVVIKLNGNQNDLLSDLKHIDLCSNPNVSSLGRLERGSSNDGWDGSNGLVDDEQQSDTKTDSKANGT